MNVEIAEKRKAVAKETTETKLEEEKSNKPNCKNTVLIKYFCNKAVMEEK